MARRSTTRQRGTVYLLVLAVTSMLVAIGVTAVIVGRIDVQVERHEDDQAQARLIGLGVVELVRYNLENDSTWRATHPHDTWSDRVGMGTGGYYYKLVDEVDGDLNDDPAEPVRLYIKAKVESATRYYSVLLRDGKAVSTTAPVTRSVNDAAEDTLTGICVTNYNYMLIGQDTGLDVVGAVRFEGVPVQPGQRLLSAEVQLTSASTRSDAALITVRAQAHDDAPAFSTLGGNISSRALTDAQVAWDPGAWADGDSGPAQRTPNLATVINEVIDRPGWQPGNAVVLTFAGSGARHARTYDHTPGTAAVLHLTYTAPGLTADYTTFRREMAE